MAQARIRIGLIYTYDTRWVAGAYYIVNLIQALNLLDDRIKPHIVLLSFTEEGRDLIREINYPYINISSLDYQLPFVSRVINKLGRICLGRNLILPRFGDDDFTIVFPYIEMESLKSIKHKVCWIPDFQPELMPEFFSQEELQNRMSLNKRYSSEAFPVVLSSYDSKSHFQSLYPGSKSPLFVLNFAVTHPDYSKLDVQQVKKKYGIEGNYFFSPNQFWVHKNQKVLIEAAHQLKKQGKTQFKIVFSGRDNDYRYPEYAKGLKQMVIDYELDKQVLFLGFIDRAEQLVLMKHSIAVVQPSLFEGWSTVIEDAKAMGQFVIASDLKVNREQLDSHAIFFDPYDPAALASILENQNQNPPGLLDRNYIDFKTKFAQELINMINTVTKK